MHILCMPTKTISLELDAYQKLKRAKRSSGESFSSVVRRGRFEGSSMPAGAALKYWEGLYSQQPDSLLSEEALDGLDEVQANPEKSPSRWED